MDCCSLCPFQPTRDLIGCYLARHTGLKSDLQLHLSTQPGYPGDRRSGVEVIMILLRPSKSLTTHSPLNKCRYRYAHLIVRNTGRGGKRCHHWHNAGKVRVCRLNGLLFQKAFAISAPTNPISSTNPTTRSDHPMTGTKF